MTPVRMVNTESLQITNAGEGVMKSESSLPHCWWECKSVQGLWGTVWRHFKKLKIVLLIPYDPLLGIYPEKSSNSQKYMHANIRSDIIYNSQDLEVT